ncbi:Hypp7089 [Branchiostoma lanceolatum]|uniref:Hypp7089 protein n=1 Tax=Branchiostoma lanceolatum TaxID=7740 RepID=A0A8J9YXH1_BRALA|nr:Hypp7089 [Branchiostoma lanceolatum]
MEAVKRVALALHFVGFVLFFVLMRVVNTVVGVLFPPLKRRMDDHTAKQAQMEGSSLAREDYIDLIFTSSSFWAAWDGHANDLQCETRVGGKAPDAALLHKDGLTQARLVDFAKKGQLVS